MRPSARTEELTVQELPDETLVFDHETGKAHCLNRIAGEVWKHCDGKKQKGTGTFIIDNPPPFR